MRSGTGEVAERIETSPDFDPVLMGIKKSQYPMLGHIDPYGTTIYNGLQQQTLISEIESLPQELVTRLGGADYLAEIVSLSRRLMSHRQFLWFVGD